MIPQIDARYLKVDKVGMGGVEIRQHTDKKVLQQHKFCSPTGTYEQASRPKGQCIE